MRKALFLLLVTLPLGAQSLTLLGAGAPLAAPTGYLHYYAITTAALQEGLSNSLNFPVCVSTVASVGCNVTTDISANLATVAHSGYVQNTVTQTGGNGGTEPADAVFGTSSTCSTLLPWETETYNATTGAWIAHVQIPTLHYLTQDIFYLCFDQAAVTTQQNTGSYAPSAVWDTNYKGVWHLNQGGGATSNDSTINGNNGTNTNTSNTTSGLFGNATKFGVNAGDSSYITTSLTVPAGTIPGTFSVWSYFTSFAGYAMAPIGWLNVNNYPFGYGIGGDGLYNTGSPYVFATMQYTYNGFNTTLQNPVSTGQWYYLTFTATKTTGTATGILYVNGVQIASYTGAADANPADTSSGNYLQISNGNYYGSVLGYEQEARFSITVRSANWITAEYNNQKASSTFLSAGTLH